MTDSYKGYALFNDVENQELRTRNRAIIMCNMYEDNPEPTDKNTTSKKGALLIMSYVHKVPEGERAPLIEEFQRQMLERGYTYAE